MYFGDNFILVSLICFSNVSDGEVVECMYSAIPWSFLLFFECLSLCIIWEGKVDGMWFFCSFIILFHNFKFKEIFVYLENSFYFAESSSFTMHFLKEKEYQVYKLF